MTTRRNKHSTVFDPPPPLHSRPPRIRKLPEKFCDSVTPCLTEKQWRSLAEWLNFHREAFEGKTASKILFEVNRLNCPVRRVTTETIEEAAKLAKLKIRN